MQKLDTILEKGKKIDAVELLSSSMVSWIRIDSNFGSIGVN